MATRNRAGFTLVELLVVIAIIATLVSLLLPAVLKSRERTRVTQCANNQGQIAKAMIMYEQDKRHLPGYANLLPGSTSVESWAPLMLPYIERRDLWEGPDPNNSWRAGRPTTLVFRKIELYVCPSDSPSDPCPLSYVVNVGQGQIGRPPVPPVPSTVLPWLPQPPADNASKAGQLGLFRNYALSGVRQVTLSDVKSTSQRPMITESTGNIDETPLLQTRQWTAINATAKPGVIVTSNAFGFAWPTLTLGSSSTNVPVVRNKPGGVGAVLPIHSGLLNVTFCDGHTDQIADDPTVVCGNFDWSDLP